MQHAEGDERADRELAAEALHRAEAEHGDLQQQEREVRGALDEVGEHVEAQADLVEGAQLAAEGAELQRGEAEGADDRLGADVLLDGAGDLGLLVAHEVAVTLGAGPRKRGPSSASGRPSTVTSASCHEKMNSRWRS
jgi:hypothetical protein